MGKTLGTVLLLALPASGKSEVRRYLANLSPEVCRDDFYMGPTVQLDDFPYVHMMHRVDDELHAIGKDRVFFRAPEQGLQNGFDWGTLIQLINEDYDDLLNKRVANPASAAQLLMQRIDNAAEKCGVAKRLAPLGADVLSALADKLEKEAAEMLAEKHENYPDTLEGKTVVIEFARGGADGSTMPLEPPFGYGYSVGQLSHDILKQSSILYIWVTPEESRRKNDARTDPNDPGSILHHGVPIAVMLGDYGCADMDWLETNSRVEGTVSIDAHGEMYDLPIGRFDNRIDETSFIREEPSEWAASDVNSVHQGLKSGFDRVAKQVFG